MKALMLFILIALFSSCMSRSTAPRNTFAPTELKHVEVTFDDLDIDEDGNVTKAEIKNYNKTMNLKPSFGQNISAPVWATIGIAASTLVMCLVSTLVRCNKSE